VDRCLLLKAEEIMLTELHTFADASEEACSASSYICLVYQDGEVLVRHVKTVTKLAHLKTVSVCKLELNAGLMGARLSKFVQTALKRKIDGRIESGGGIESADSFGQFYCSKLGPSRLIPIPGLRQP
jgi:hypothetical protein